MSDASAVASTDAPSQGWWRRNAGWLVGALVLGAWAIAMPYRDALHAYQARHASYPVDVARGASASYEDARWRVLSSRRLDRPDPASGVTPRPDAVVWVVRFEVTPDAGTRGDALDRCEGAIGDAAGRKWDANPLALSHWRGEFGTMCGSRLGPDFRRIVAQPGQPFVFEHVYLLPRAPAPRGLHAEIRMGYPKTAAPGSYLRFAL